MPDPLSLEGMDQVPDPAARVAAMAVPPARPPVERSPTRADRRVLGRAALVFVAGWVAGLLALFGLRPDLASPGVAVPIVAWLLCGGIVLGAVLRPGVRGLPAGVRAVQHAVWIVPVAYAAGAALVAAPEAEPFTWASIQTCLGLTTLMTIGPLAAAALFLRRSFLSAPGWRGAAVGGLAGLLGSTGIHAHCPCHTLEHLLAAHGAAIALGAVAGATLGRLGGRS